jgi:hypothetical protein
MSVETLTLFAPDPRFVSPYLNAIPPIASTEQVPGDSASNGISYILRLSSLTMRSHYHVQESQWLMKLHTYGLLRNSFRPPQVSEAAPYL